jgi:hypothetical protein
MSATWYYAQGNRQRGPVSLEEVRGLLASGQLAASDLVWREGMATWAAARTVQELAAVSAADPPAWNVPPGMPGAEGGAGNHLPGLAAGEVDIGVCLNRAWALYMKDFGAVFSITALMMVLDWAGLFLALRISPNLAGYIANALVDTPLMAGLFWFYLKKIRGETAGVKDLFAGYRLAFVPLLVAAMIKGVLVFVGIIFCILPGLFLLLIWAFTTPLIIDKRMDFWPAMETSRRAVMQNVFPFLLLFLSAVGIFLAGFLACGVGFFFTAPLSFLMIAYAYNDLFGSSAMPGA